MITAFTNRCPANRVQCILHAVADALHYVDAPLGLIKVVLGLAGRELADRKHRKSPQAVSRRHRGPGKIRLQRSTS